MTFGENLLWSKLEGRQMLGYSFIRQIPILNYIVDFLCRELKLIIEIDGSSHNFKVDADTRRQSNLEKEGYFVLRFREQEVRTDINNVVQRIVDWIEPQMVSHPPAAPRVRPPRGGSMRPLPRRK